ncbi:hypothetical protein OYC64_000060 [Pagothenia borchgrevinki]|uniref:Uncharacterized protein n=1 Tax=Pagothenia borchgrevinki TaxID=8213 RepID=A0ABD2HBN6_PAGBO
MPSRSLGDASVHSSLSSALPSPSSLPFRVWGEKVGMKDGQSVEGSNDFLQLLKSHKEKTGGRDERSEEEE